jgi:hypothetical protein
MLIALLLYLDAGLGSNPALQLLFATLLLYALVKAGDVIAHALERDLFKTKKPS